MTTILWRRLDLPGHECARIVAREDGWELAGCAVLSHDRAACRLDYLIRCDRAWRTRAVRVGGWIGAREVEVELAVGPDGWSRGGEALPALAGCVDVDLQFSPVTNTLPIRRLALDVGAAAEVRAAWLRFPECTAEPLEQRYERLATDRYRYTSAGGRFERELTVDAAGLVTLYPDFWRAEG